MKDLPLLRDYGITSQCNFLSLLLLEGVLEIFSSEQMCFLCGNIKLVKTGSFLRVCASEMTEFSLGSWIFVNINHFNALGHMSFGVVHKIPCCKLTLVLCFTVATYFKV